ncbi:MAG: lipoate--protein ligase family protein [Candidatus Omnitrophica bacterium]|nr:lipoate--protein ligase family protein [Candidatus Omnitrophota bacterium]
MDLIDYNAKEPCENLAMDEFLLMEAERGELGETFRVWESKEYFVVLGRAEKAEENCLMENCSRGGIKVLRRISGGGTILQGPGCLNYSAVLAYEKNEKFKNIITSYECILGGISELLRGSGYDVKFLPISDLAINNRKISGNAQARKRKYFLHHGTFLYDFDIDRISNYLKHPPKEPAYRKGRGHAEFISNIPIGKKRLEGILMGSFGSVSCIKTHFSVEGKLEKIIRAKYSLDEWNFYFA